MHDKKKTQPKQKKRSSLCYLPTVRPSFQVSTSIFAVEVSVLSPASAVAGEHAGGDISSDAVSGCRAESPTSAGAFTADYKDFDTTVAAPFSASSLI